MFGDLKATDPRIREAAVQANALGFIMQNDEDVNSKSVQTKILQEYRQVTDLKLRSLGGSYNNLNLITDKVQEGKIGYKELALIGDVIKHLNHKGLQDIDTQNHEFFEAVS